MTIAMLMVLLLAISVLPFSNDADGGEGSSPDGSRQSSHPPIRIDSDADLVAMAASEGWKGNGTVGNPYLIRDYDIDGGGLTSCIYVGNVTKHFEVRDCHLHDAVKDVHDDTGALEVLDTSNGSLTNNTLYGNENFNIFVTGSTSILVQGNDMTHDGFQASSVQVTSSDGCTIEGNYVNHSSIRLYASDSNLVSDNVVREGSIAVHSSTANTVSNNTVTTSSTAIFVYYSHGNRVEHNHVTSSFHAIDLTRAYGAVVASNDITVLDQRSFGYAVVLTLAEGCTLRDNDMHNAGIMLEGSSIEDFASHTIGSSNSLDGKMVLSVKNRTGVKVTGDYGQVLVLNCDSFNVSRCRFEGGADPVVVCWSRDGVVYGNSFENNSDYAVVVTRSQRVTVEGNRMVDGYSFALLEDSDANTVSRNQVYNPDRYLVYIARSDDTLVTRNCVVDSDWTAVHTMSGDRTEVSYNHIENSSGSGISLAAVDNYVHHNVLLDNNHSEETGLQSGSQCRDQTYSYEYNSWNASGEGNYWSDYEEKYPNATNDGWTWDTPYVLRSHGPKADHHPLVHATDLEPPLVDPGGDEVIDQGETVRFDGTGSTDDTAIARYTWYLLYGGEPVQLVGPTASFTFHESGVYRVFLRVTDVNGNWGEADLLVTVRDTEPPAAWAGDDVVVDQHTNVTFNGVLSKDNVRITRWTWSFTYDGSPVELEGATAHHVFDLVGTYNVTLTVLDTAGNEGIDHMLVTVRDSDAPLAACAGDLEANIGEVTQLDGSASTDNVGVTGWTWSFEHNGTLVNLMGERTSFSFRTPGVHRVTLTVADGAGNEGSTSFNVTVRDVDPPSFGPQEDPMVLVTADLRVLMNAAWWSDDDLRFPEGATFGWRLERGGEVFSGEGPGAWFDLEEDGLYQATFNATDPSGNEAVETLQLDVRWRPSGPLPPVADAGGDVTVVLHDTVELSGAFERGDLPVVATRWYILLDTPLEVEGRNASFVADRVGELIVTFEVEDEAGNTADDTLTVTVEPRLPWIRFQRGVGDVPISGTVTLSGWAVGDVPIESVAYLVDGGAWSEASGTENWTFELDTTRLANGEHELSMRVSDGHGSNETGPIQFTVLNEAPDDGDGGGVPVAYWAAIVVTVTAIIAVLAVVLVRRKASPHHQEDLE